MKKIVILITALAFIACKGEKSNHALVVTFLKGKVTIESAGASKKARIGSLLKAEDTLKVGKKSRADLQISKGTVVRIASSSSLKINQLVANLKGTNKTKLQLDRGSLYAKVQKQKEGSSFSVKTPTAVAGVRGTEFHVSSKEGKDTIAVTSGKVAVENKAGKSTVVKEGTEVKGDDEELSASKIDASKLKKIKKMASIKKFDAKSWKDIQGQIGSANDLTKVGNLKELFKSSGKKPSKSVDKMLKGLNVKGSKSVKGHAKRLKDKSKAELEKLKKVKELNEKLKKIKSPF